MISRVSRLEARVEELEELLGLRCEQPRPRDFAPCPWKLLGLLTRRPLVTHEFAFRAFYGWKAEGDQPADLRIIATHLARLRKTLRRYGISVSTSYSEGYFLDEENRRRAARLVGDSARADAASDPGARGNGDTAAAVGALRGGQLADATGPRLGVAADDMATPKHQPTNPHHA
jgi:hypothetical protein